MKFAVAVAISGWVVACGLCSAQETAAAEPETATFGITTVVPFGFCGRLYAIPEDTTLLPRFEQLQPLGNIYTNRLDVAPRSFQSGFPGVTGRFEWFAIDYTARFWVEEPGKYSFLLSSDDGAALYIDERRLVDNDGIHAPTSLTGNVSLTGGIHEIRVSYFQGPRFYVALRLYVRPPKGKWQIFDTSNFKPPANPAHWKYPNTLNLDLTVDPCKAGGGQPGRLLNRGRAESPR
jgi:hypothetical protein